MSFNVSDSKAILIFLFIFKIFLERLETHKGFYMIDNQIFSSSFKIIVRIFFLLNL